MANGSATPNRLTSLWITAGINTAYLSPTGTATVVNYWTLVRSGTAKPAVLFALSYGPIGSTVLGYPVTGLAGQKQAAGNGAFILGSAGNEGIFISAASSTAFSFYAGGLLYT